MKTEEKYLLIGGGGLLAAGLIAAIVVHNKKRSNSQIFTAKSPDKSPDKKTDKKTQNAPVTPNVTGQATGLVASRTLIKSANQSTAFAYAKNSATVIRPDADDIAIGCFTMLCRLPLENTIVKDANYAGGNRWFMSGNNPDKTRLNNDFNLIAVEQNVIVATSVPVINSRSTDKGLDGFMLGVFNSLQTDFTQSQSNNNDWNFGNSSEIAFDFPNYPLPVFNYISSGSATAKTDNITANTDLINLFQNLINEFLPQIKNNLQKITSIEDINFFAGKLDTLYSTIKNLNKAPQEIQHIPARHNGIVPARDGYFQFQSAAQQLVTIDRWIRQKIVYQQIQLFDMNLTGSPDDWNRIRAQVVYDIAMSQVSILDRRTVVNGALDGEVIANPPNMQLYFNDREAINLLNYVQPVLAPTAQQLAQQQAAKESAAAQQEATQIAIAKLVISLLL